MNNEEIQNRIDEINNQIDEMMANDYNAVWTPEYINLQNEKDRLESSLTNKSENTTSEEMSNEQNPINKGVQNRIDEINNQINEMMANDYNAVWTQEYTNLKNEKDRLEGSLINDKNDKNDKNKELNNLSKNENNQDLSTDSKKEYTYGNTTSSQTEISYTIPKMSNNNFFFSQTSNKKKPNDTEVKVDDKDLNTKKEELTDDKKELQKLLKKELEELQRLRKMYNDLDEQRKKLASNDEKINEILKKMGKIKSQMVDLNDKINKILEKLNKNDKKAEHVIDNNPEKNSNKHDNIDKMSPGQLNVLASSILTRVGSDLELERNDHKKSNAMNYKFTKTFKTLSHETEFIYRLTNKVSATAASLVGKARSKFWKLFTSQKDKERIEKVNKKVDNLTDEEIEILFRGLTSKEYIADGVKPIVLEAVSTKISEKIHEKVNNINSRIQEIYLSLCKDAKKLKQINKELNKNEVTNEQSKRLISEKNKLLKGKKELIKELKDLQVTGNRLLNSNGNIHGMKENIKATESKMNRRGKFFSSYTKKDDTKLTKRMRDAKDRLANLLYSEKSSDEEILQAFIDEQKAYIDGTKIKNSIVGKREVGQFSQQILVKDVDYRNDPFISNLTTTFAMVATGINLYSSISTAIANNKAIAKVNAHNQSINEQNTLLQGDIRKTGTNIKEKSSDVLQGNIASDRISSGYIYHGNEVSALNRSSSKLGHDWSVVGTDYYHKIDGANHIAYQNFGIPFEKQLGKITAKTQSGKLSTIDAMNQLSSLSNGLYTKMDSSLGTFIEDLKNYMIKYPHKGDKALLNSYEQIQASIPAIKAGRLASKDILKYTENLEDLTIKMSEIAPEMANVIPEASLATASTALLCLRTIGNMQGIYEKNDIKDKDAELMEEAKDAFEDYGQENKKIESNQNDLEKMMDDVEKNKKSDENKYSSAKMQ